jgi:hypothetical protein
MIDCRAETPVSQDRLDLDGAAAGLGAGDLEKMAMVGWARGGVAQAMFGAH